MPSGVTSLLSDGNKLGIFREIREFPVNFPHFVSHFHIVLFKAVCVDIFADERTLAEELQLGKNSANSNTAD